MALGLVLSGGPTHPFEQTTPMLVDLLDAQGVTTQVVTDPGAVVDALAAGERGEREPVDLFVVHALRWRMEQERYADLRADHAAELSSDDLAVLDRFVRAGGALLALHTAVICFDADPVWRDLCGAAWAWGRSSHPPLGPARVQITEAGHHHEITRGLEPFVIDDEVYGFLDEVPGLEPLLVSAHGGRDHPLVWARTIGAGRVVTDVLGHGPESLRHPAHRRVLVGAIRWLLRSTGGRQPGIASGSRSRRWS